MTMRNNYETEPNKKCNVSCRFHFEGRKLRDIICICYHYHSFFFFYVQLLIFKMLWLVTVMVATNILSNCVSFVHFHARNFLLDFERNFPYEELEKH